ncbi:hypothetical protein G6M87_22075 [Rhizobium rhizogenes]|nr:MULTISPECIES: hypothetical protein [Rhizobium]EJK88099.1 hypothetical protein PMI03_00257 [Rhizobium sp. AP16]NTI24474.1 hypothetical protein [Rhizobium rhizogenes]NTI43794.1 hypothetical protein [Rhizobium rhizogenes]NTI63769.1 hypothetical protein [Rhizobium rhizogenes]QTG08221.1 hypothetical protein G6M87_22075 [Rhizobium rhizogenes]
MNTIATPAHRPGTRERAPDALPYECIIQQIERMPIIHWHVRAAIVFKTSERALEEIAP